MQNPCFQVGDFESQRGDYGCIMMCLWVDWSSTSPWVLQEHSAAQPQHSSGMGVHVLPLYHDYIIVEIFQSPDIKNCFYIELYFGDNIKIVYLLFVCISRILYTPWFILCFLYLIFDRFSCTKTLDFFKSQYKCCLYLYLLLQNLFNSG